MFEDLRRIELKGVVEDGVEDENAPGLHVGDGLKGLDGKALRHAANELVTGNGPDGIARSVGFLHGQRELEAPFEHHFENDIEFSAVRFNHIKHELTGLRAFDSGIVKCKDAEADVRQALGLLAKFELAVGFLKSGLCFVASTTNAFRSKLSQIMSSV